MTIAGAAERVKQLDKGEQPGLQILHKKLLGCMPSVSRDRGYINFQRDGKNGCSASPYHRFSSSMIDKLCVDFIRDFLDNKKGELDDFFGLKRWEGT